MAVDILPQRLYGVLEAKKKRQFGCLVSIPKFELGFLEYEIEVLPP